MADVDTSFYPKAQNPLTSLGSTVDVARGITSQNLLQQQLAGRQGMADLYQGAVDPSTGQIDTNRLIQGAGQAGILAPDVMKNAQELALQQQGLTQAKIKTAIDTNNYAANGLDSMLNDPSIFDQSGKVIDPKALNKGLAKIAGDTVGISGGSYSAAQAINDWQDIVNSDDPRLKMQQHLATSQMRAGHAELAHNTLFAKNPALATNEEMWDPNANSGRGAYVPNVKPAVGQPGFGSDKNPDQNSNPQSQINQNSSPLDGAFKTKQANPPAKSSNDSQLMLSAPPGVEGMQNKTGDQAADRVGEVIANARNAPISQDVNNQIIRLADKLGQGGVGPVQSDVTNLVGKIADTPGLGAIYKAVTGDKPATDAPGQLMELKKYLLRAAQTRAQNLGAHTDFTQNLNVDANPNDKQFPEVISKLANYNKALDIADQGKANAMQAYPGATSNPAQQEKFENEFRNNMNVDVYRMMLASPSERQDILGSMSPSERQQLVLSRRKLSAMQAIPQQTQQQ